MALVQDPSDSGYLSYLTEHRHLPGRTEAINPWAKHPRRPFNWSQWKAYNRHERVAYPGWPLGPEPDETVDNLRPHHVALYNANISRHRHPRFNSRWTDPHNGRLAAARLTRYADVDEGCDVARSTDIRLPGEYRRPPSLERQDAFRDARTVKRGIKRSFTQHALAADDEELYRLGLLYDDEHERGEAFSLNAIVHEEPMWNVKFRPTKRRGRSLKTRKGEDEALEYALDLALSFAALGDDEALAAFLMAPSEEELVTQESAEPVAGSGSQETRPNLTVVYELEEDAEDSHVSTCWGHFFQNFKEGEEDNDWAFLDGDAGSREVEEDDDGSDTTTNADADTWIMLGGDGSKQVRL